MQLLVLWIFRLVKQHEQRSTVQFPETHHVVPGFLSVMMWWFHEKSQTLVSQCWWHVCTVLENLFVFARIWSAKDCQLFSVILSSGLEPEIQKLISKHKQELKKLRTLHEAELLQADDRAAQRYVRQCEELRQQLEKEKEEQCQRERELAKQRYALSHYTHTGHLWLSMFLLYLLWILLRNFKYENPTNKQMRAKHPTTHQKWKVT